jgi:hypothetical protein
MKRSNIIISSAVLLLIAWLLISGWMQANSYNTIKSGRTSKYTTTIGIDKVKSKVTFKNIKIDFGKQPFYPKISIFYNDNQELAFSESLEKQYSYNISGDTLYLRINYERTGIDDYVNIGIPFLKSLKISSAFEGTGASYTDINHNISVSGFNANTMSVIYNSQNDLKLDNNKLKKLELSGDFHGRGTVNITNYPDYDSLNVDIKGKDGTLILSKYPKAVENKKQCISIKVPGTFNIEAEAGASIWSQITVKK